MPRIRFEQRAKIWIIWKITTHHLKVLRHRYLSDLETYNKYSIQVINFFRRKENAIKEDRKIRVDRLSYMNEISQFIENIK